MKKLLNSILLLTFLTSCVSTKITPMTPENSVLIKNKKVAIIHSKKPDFAAITYGNMMWAAFTGGIIGSIKMTRDGNKIVNDNAIEDPAIVLSKNLAADFGKKYNVKIIEDSVVKDISYDAEKIAKEYRNIADYALDLRTINWSFGYLPMRPDSFRVIYSSKLRLIDTQNSKIIAEGFCARIPEGEQTRNAPSYNQLLFNNAQILKDELVKSASYCTDLLKEKVFAVVN